MNAREVALRDKLSRAHKWIEDAIKEYDIRAFDTKTDEEMWARAADVLDWGECGICGRRAPEKEGVFVCIQKASMAGPAEYEWVCDRHEEDGV